MRLLIINLTHVSRIGLRAPVSRRRALDDHKWFVVRWSLRGGKVCSLGYVGGPGLLHSILLWVVISDPGALAISLVQTFELEPEVVFCQRTDPRHCRYALVLRDGKDTHR